jgi:LmbE family N-acetylglucosaminyl deacetylase
MAVHAHPDDEATSTGGILARYSAEGVRTVLVTCTDGECGDAPGGIKPGEPGHDPVQLAVLRRQELEASCRVLGVDDLELLGYGDSGMMGWPQNDLPGAFWQASVDEAADRVAALLERYRPQVLVTYDPGGFYGHPDHIQAHRVTMAAVARTGIPDKVYWPTVPRSGFVEFGQRLREAGLMPEGEEGPPPDMGSPDEDIAATVDVSAYADRKYDALATHASQSDNIFFLRMGRQMFAEFMGHEYFLRPEDRTGSALPEEDLFGGLR